MVLTQTKLWKALEQQALLFFTQRKMQKFPTLSVADIKLDYSTQQLDTVSYSLLLELASECQLKSKINALFSGEIVNASENKPALHTALRMPKNTQLLVNGRDIMADIMAAQDGMQSISDEIRTGEWLGFSGKPINSIVNIGIGGSQLGSKFCLHALAEYCLPSLSYHFISDMDPLEFNRVTAKLNPETTLFIIASKSFTTAETLFNLKKAQAWIKRSESFHNHFIAVTAFPERARLHGITHVLPIWEWIGGRYSVCSAINLITSIAIGFNQFTQLLQGAHEMDEHFKQESFETNMPVNLALLGIWNINFLKIHQLLILTYGYSLDYLTPYIQQLDMESNGKSIDINGREVNYSTGPIVWGGSGNQAQHSYYQLLCQGTHRTAIDLVSVDTNQHQSVNHLCYAQKKVLSQGVNNIQEPEKAIPGNIPLNHIILTAVTPYSLGALIALYEHKTYVQSVVWQINPFNQPGVESSKIIQREYSFQDDS